MALTSLQSLLARTLTAALLALTLVAPQTASAEVGFGVSINFGPPAIPVYVQPPVPAAGYVWTPGFWSWGPSGYFWVPGTWVLPPQTGYLWTPGYWANTAGSYAWNPGYWAPHVGYYGGIDYGYGYYGNGYVGGGWWHNAFRYNTAVTNVNTTIVRNVYVDRTVYVDDRAWRRASYFGPGGSNIAPTPGQLAVEHERRFAQTQAQIDHASVAARDRRYLAAFNGGRPNPERAAVARPLGEGYRAAIVTSTQGGVGNAAQNFRAMEGRQMGGPRMTESYRHTVPTETSPVYRSAMIDRPAPPHADARTRTPVFHQPVRTFGAPRAPSASYRGGGEARRR
jgi:hypothetical protein